MLSRVADSIYWLGRYLERAEHTARLVAVKLDTMVEQSGDDAEASWSRVFAAISAGESPPGQATMNEVLRALVLDRRNPSSLIASLRFARDNARQVREQISTEVWESLNRLYLHLQSESAESAFHTMPAATARMVLDNLYTLEGVSYSTLRHGEGWHFLELGRYIERAQLVSRLLDIYFGAPLPGYPELPPPKHLDWLALLKFCTAFEPYCKVHTAAIVPKRVAQFLMFDAEFPHSVRFSVDRVREALRHVAPGAPPLRRSACERLAGKLKADIDYAQIDALNGAEFDRFLASVSAQCEQVHDAVYAAYILYDAGAVL